MRLSRRDFLGAAGVGTAGVVALGAAGLSARPDSDDGTAAAAVPSSGAVPFIGAHQAGIVTPAQDRLHFVAFDVVTDDRAALVTLLRAWTAAARRMTAGLDAGPGDTGETLGLPPAGLTLTVGFGPTLFTGADGTDRFGLAARRPVALVELPAFPGDALDPAISGGDIAVQACADDPQVAVHAVRNLARLGQGVVRVRWSQLGFGRTSSTTADQATPRNLFGFKDGTANLRAEQTAALDRFVWVSGTGTWLDGGSYLVSRRIRMLVETWDEQGVTDQERTIGRTKAAGAPLGRTGEFDPVEFTGEIPPTSHVFLSHPTNTGTAILRRGYSFVEGSDGSGQLDAGLFFLCYQADPTTGFVQVQRNLRTDAMNRFVRHTSSGLFACPPGLTDDEDWWGSGLLS